MPNQPSITIIKRFQYRGADEEFSNKYHFSGTVPTSSAEWKTLADAIIAAEKLATSSLVKFTRAYGYVAGSNLSVAQIDYKALGAEVTGQYAPIGNTQQVAGDIAAVIRWLTPGVTSRGKKIYLRKYMHGIYSDLDADKLAADQRTKLATFAAKMIDGTLPGSATYCGPQGATASMPEVAQYLTTRTLKRRGKRPPTTP